mmetsp:Transcript_55485/g.146085  ORF Transcript_55485/g.146085 Transcript_55485/m.146085 type:complete len:222 (+) Transcript_55485:276-941(+)
MLPRWQHTAWRAAAPPTGRPIAPMASSPQARTSILLVLHHLVDVAQEVYVVHLAGHAVLADVGEQARFVRCAGHHHLERHPREPDPLPADLLHDVHDPYGVLGELLQLLVGPLQQLVHRGGALQAEHLQQLISIHLLPDIEAQRGPVVHKVHAVQRHLVTRAGDVRRHVDVVPDARRSPRSLAQRTHRVDARVDQDGGQGDRQAEHADQRREPVVHSDVRA